MRFGTAHGTHTGAGAEDSDIAILFLLLLCIFKHASREYEYE